MARVILVADDSPTIQKKAVGILKGEGFEVETVSNGVAAIKRLAVLHPVVILADVSMPGRDGYEVCDFVKKSAELSHVPVLLVASDMEPYDETRGTHVKADGIIKKPFDPQELISHVVKFAEVCNATAPTLAMPAVAPPVAPEPAPEFAISSENPEETPSVESPVPPDFAAVSEGIAFAEPGVEEAPAYSPEPPPTATEGAYAAPPAEAEIALEPAAAAEFLETIPAAEPQSAPASDSVLGVEEPPAAGPITSPPPPEQTASSVEGLEAAAQEPVFIEEQAAPVAEAPLAAAQVRTMIFRAPAEIAEPVWKDETVPAPPAPEPVATTPPEPQLEAEAQVAPTEIPPEPAPEPPDLAPPVAATSLDSFSLDDATAGQVRFPSHAADLDPEVAQAAPVEEPPAAETVPLEHVPEAATTEFAPHEPASEVVSTESATPEAAPEAAPPEPPAEVSAPAPAYDWALIYTVVHKVVVKMSPPALPMEAVEEMARRLADEIATEISAESSPPQA